MTNDERRVAVATRVRALGHELVAHTLTNDELDELASSLDALTVLVRHGRERVRVRPHVGSTTSANVVADMSTDRPLVADSFVAGHANPLGLGASLHRDGAAAVMTVTLGAAFEGAPGRAHGGVVAALVDETMGLALAMSGVLAFTVQLDISFRAPTPVGRPISARAWLARREGRKLFVEASVHAGDELIVATARAVFLAVPTETFLETTATSAEPGASIETTPGVVPAPHCEVP